MIVNFKMNFSFLNFAVFFRQDNLQAENYAEYAKRMLPAKNIVKRVLLPILIIFI